MSAKTNHAAPASGQWLAVLTAVIGYLIWGLSTLFSKITLHMTAPSVVLAIRFLMATVFMSLLLPFPQFRVSFRGKNWVPITLLVVTELLYFYFESFGILYTNATYAGVFLATVPVVSIGTGILFLKEYPTKRQALFCLLPVAGAIILTVSGNSLGILRPIGVVFLVCCCLSSAAYKTANRKSSEEFSSFERTYIVIVACAVVFTVVALFSTGGDLQAFLVPLSDHTFLFSSIMLSLCCSVLSNLLVNYSAARMPVLQSSSFSSLSTLCSMTAGVIFLHEPMTFSLLLGAVLILVGIHQVIQPK